VLQSIRSINFPCKRRQHRNRPQPGWDGPIWHSDSGGNSFHGSAYEIHPQRSVRRGRTVFRHQERKSPINQYGIFLWRATVEGPGYFSRDVEKQRFVIDNREEAPNHRRQISSSGAAGVLANFGVAKIPSAPPDGKPLAKLCTEWSGGSR